jgi:hypothetical protein
MRNKITKKQGKEFVAGITKGLLELGAVVQPKCRIMTNQVEFKLDTIVGNLNITLRDDQNYCFTVFSKFDDVAKAKEKFDCNPYSGKYNFHRGKSELFSMEQMIEFAMMHFECTQPKELV